MRLRSILLLLVLLLAGAGYLLSQPRWLFALATRLYPGALYYSAHHHSEDELPERTPRLVALTIDDGPGPYTQDILSLLARYDAKATFFNISEHLPGYEAVVTQAVQEGHELGNHLTADEPSILMSESEFETDLLAAEAALLPFTETKDAETGITPKWLRPGMGFYTPGMVMTAQRYGYHLVLGNNFPYDTHIPSPRFARSFILGKVQPGDIIVLHDGQGESEQRGDRTLETLKTILPILKNRGYSVTTLSELEAVDQTSSSCQQLC